MSKNPAVVFDEEPEQVILIPKRSYEYLQSMESGEVTRQGVRNLNGPRMNGRGHNGHRSTCSHANALPFDEIRMVEIEDTFGNVIDKRAKTVRVQRCAFCHVEISNSREG